MTDMTAHLGGQPALERGYQRVLACYPRDFRRESGPEILAVLMSSARDGQQRVGLAEAVDLIRGGLRMRMRPRVRPPRAVFAAVRVMIFGAVLELAAFITMLVTRGDLKAAVFSRNPGTSTAQWHGVIFLVTTKEVGAPLAMCVWLALAWAINRGNDGGRLAGVACFALATMSMIFSLSQGALAYAPGEVAIGFALMLTGLVTLVLIFTKPSNAYFRQRAAQQ